MSRAAICKKKATLDDSLRTRAKQNTKLTHTFCEDLTTIKSPSREGCVSTFIPRIADLNETAQARAITQDLGTFTDLHSSNFSASSFERIECRNMPKPDLLELKDARKRYEHGLKMLETLSVEFFCFFPAFPTSQDSTSAMRLPVRQIASKAHLGARYQRSRGFRSLGSDTM